MDFFERQRIAKRTSGLLVGLFFLVSGLLVLAIMLATSMFVYVTNADAGVSALTGKFSLVQLLLSPWSLTAGLVTMSIIIIGALIEWFRLSEGGHALARRMNAKRIFKATKKHAQDALNVAVTNDKHVPKTDSNSAHIELERKEKKLLEVVENMSIASGMSQPAVYVLTYELGINAFVAGFSAKDMALVVTQGALEELNETELYGIVGHEFSHIAHGDTKLYMRLIILLGGLQLIHELSGLIFAVGDDDTAYRTHAHDGSGSGSRQSAANLRHPLEKTSFERKIAKYQNDSWGSDIFFGNYSRCRRDNAWSGVASIIVLFLFMVFCISSIGVFAARMVKYAVLRQREYLADAASVQFTRSHGVLDALVKILKTPAHSSIYHPSRQALSHLFFASSLPTTDVFSNVFSTHPPIEKRIRALNERAYVQLKQEDRVNKRQRKQKALTQAERNEIERIKQAQTFREPSSYDGVPLEFTSSPAKSSSVESNIAERAQLQPEATSSALGKFAEADLAGLAAQIEALALPKALALPEALALPLAYSATQAAQPCPQQAKPKSTASKPTMALRDTTIAGFEHSAYFGGTKAGNLIHQALSEPKGALELIAAALAHHQQCAGTKEVFRPEDYQVSRMLYEAIHRAKGVDEVALIVDVLSSLPDLSAHVCREAAGLYLERLNSIASLDGKISLLEILLLERISECFGLLDDVFDGADITQESIWAACIRLIYELLRDDGHSKTDMPKIAQRLFRLLGLPKDAAKLKPLVKQAAQLSVAECLCVLSMQSIINKKELIHTLETTMLANGHLSSDEAATLTLLQWRLLLARHDAKV